MMAIIHYDDVGAGQIEDDKVDEDDNVDDDDDNDDDDEDGDDDNDDDDDDDYYDDDNKKLGMSTNIAFSGFIQTF